MKGVHWSKKIFYKKIHLFPHTSELLVQTLFSVSLKGNLLLGSVTGKCSNNLCWVRGVWIYHRDGDFANSFIRNFYNLPLREVLSYSMI